MAMIAHGDGSVCEACGEALTPATIQAMGLCRACHEGGRGAELPGPHPRCGSTPEAHRYYPAGHYDLGENRCSCGAPVDPRRRHTPAEGKRRQKHGGTK